MPCESVSTAHRPWRRLALCAALVLVTGAASACADTTSDESSEKKSSITAASDEQSGPCSVLRRAHVEEVLDLAVRRVSSTPDDVCEYESLTGDATVSMLTGGWEDVSTRTFAIGDYAMVEVDDIGDEAVFAISSVDGDENLLFALVVRDGDQGILVTLSGRSMEATDQKLPQAKAIAETALAHFDADPWGRLDSGGDSIAS